jgi:hypothetical protein
MNLDPMQDLQIGDNTHKLQEHVPKSVDVSQRILEGARDRWLAGRTMIYFAPLLGAFVCASRWRRLLRLRLLPIACPILFHDIGAYASRASIGLRRRAVVFQTG